MEARGADMENVGGSRNQRPGSVEVAPVGSLAGLLLASAAFRIATSSVTSGSRPAAAASSALTRFTVRGW